jgi:hypothetical protein
VQGPEFKTQSHQKKKKVKLFHLAGNTSLVPRNTKKYTKTRLKANKLNKFPHEKDNYAFRVSHITAEARTVKVRSSQLTSIMEV